MTSKKSSWAGLSEVGLSKFKTPSLLAYMSGSRESNSGAQKNVRIGRVPVRMGVVNGLLSGMGEHAGISIEDYLHTSFPNADPEFRDGEIVERNAGLLTWEGAGLGGHVLWPVAEPRSRVPIHRNPPEDGAK